MSKQMLTIVIDPKKADPAHVREVLDLAPEDVDPHFGVVSIDPTRNLYAILVTEEAVRRISAQPGVQGPFANPRIETFGPPKKT
jgi:hypothetical protein